MDSEIKDILQLLQEGKLDCKQAIKLINSYNIEKNSPKQSRKIKISIYDSDDNRTIKFPAIPYSLITSLGSLGLWISSIALKNNKELDDDAKNALEVLKEVDLKEMFNVLRECPPCDMVNIHDGGDGDEVIISIL